MPSHTGQRAVLLYDASCGFCRWAVAQVLRRDRALRLRPVRIQSEEGERLSAVLDPAAQERVGERRWRT